MKNLLLLGPLAIGFCLADVDPAHAQRRGGGISVNTPGFSINYGNPGSYGRGYGYGNPGSYGQGYGYGYPGSYGRGYGYGNPYAGNYRPYYGTWYQNYPNSYPVNPSYGYGSMYTGAPSTYYPDGLAANADNQNQYAAFYAGNAIRSQTELRVQLPDPNARLTIDGQPTTQRGTERVFAVPNLEAGRNYSYVLRATWMEAGREEASEKKIDFKLGEQLAVNFTDGQQRPDNRSNEIMPRTGDVRHQDRPQGLEPRLDATVGQAVMGKIVRIDGKQVVFMPADGGAERTFQLADDGVIMRDGAKTTFQQLKAEMPVSVTLRSGSPTVATRIEVRESSPDDEIKP